MPLCDFLPSNFEVVLKIMTTVELLITSLCNRPPKINLIRGKFILGQGAKKELGGSKFIRGHCCFGGILKFLPLPQKELCGCN